MASFEDKKRALSAAIQASRGEVRLEKDTSNLFRGRKRPPAQRLDVRAFNEVLSVDPVAGFLDTGAMTTYADLTDACLARGVMPCVVPQLKSITIGGACAGLGIEATSFRYGLAHETVEEMEVMTAAGDILTVTPTNEHADLFFGLPNSFGTLGYALRIKARVIPVKPFVEVRHHRYADPIAFFEALRKFCDDPGVDFVDGVVFRPGVHYISIGRFVDSAPYTSDYTYLNIYYRSIERREVDYLTTLDYIWRWDTDWFWCSRILYAQNPIVRRLLGKKRLNSIFYKKIIDWAPGYGIRKAYRKVFGIHQETIIQDVDVTIDHAPEFLDFFQKNIGLEPVWICPFRSPDPERRYSLWPIDPKALYVNFGFWDSKTFREPRPPGYYNRLIERKLAELGGIKSLYSDSYFTPEEFWANYNKPAYDQLKRRYDPEGRLSDLYRKCVERA